MDIENGSRARLAHLEAALSFDLDARTFRVHGMPRSLRLADVTTRSAITWADAFRVGRGLPFHARLGNEPAAQVARSFASAGTTAEAIAELGARTEGTAAPLTESGAVHGAVARALCAAVVSSIEDSAVRETLLRFAGHCESDLDIAAVHAIQRIDDGRATELDRELAPTVDEATVSAAQLALDVLEARQAPVYWGSLKRLAPLLCGRIDVQRAVVNVLAATPRSESLHGGVG